MRKLSFMALLFLCEVLCAHSTTSYAQTSTATVSTLPLETRRDLLRINETRLDQDRVAMTTLGVWAVANVGVGLWGDFIRRDTGDSQRFLHQMNWLWGVANGAIAGVGLASALSADPASSDYTETLAKVRAREVVFAVNGALDLAYMGAGAWLWERGFRTSERRLEGYGQSLVIQGGFLLLFDGIMYSLSRRLSHKVDKLPVQLVPTPTGGMALVGRF